MFGKCKQKQCYESNFFSIFIDVSNQIGAHSKHNQGLLLKKHNQESPSTWLLLFSLASFCKVGKYFCLLQQVLQSPFPFLFCDQNHDENAIHTKEYHIQELQKLNKVRPTLSILSSWQNIIYKHEFCSHLYSNKYLYTHIAALSILHLEEDLLLHPTQLNNLVEL